MKHEHTTRYKLTALNDLFEYSVKNHDEKMLEIIREHLNVAHEAVYQLLQERRVTK